MRLLALCLGLLLTINANARVRIDITSANTEPLPIAITAFHTEDSSLKSEVREIRDVVAGNLKNSALFNVIEQNMYLQTPASIADGGPVFSEWRVINTELLLVGNLAKITEDGTEKLQADFRLWDTVEEREMVGWRYKVDAKFARYLGHLISDKVYEAVTGEPGYFSTRIVYIGETGRSGKRKRLCVMDQDGGNQQCLTSGDHLVLTPRFNPTSQKIIYMSYARNVPRLYILDLPTGEQELLGDFQGLNSSPRFSPDGKKVVMTLTKDDAGNPEIYSMDLKSRKLTRLTYHRAIDTSPSFSPDGKHIVFNSDRGGNAQLYIMDAKTGENVERLTFGEGRYYAPEWSPRGDLIAFVKSKGGRFSIGVIDKDGEEERMLTDSYMDESPTWSPNGRVIAFSRQMGNSTRIYSIDLTGYNEHQLPTPTDASDPAWSPLLK